MAVSVTRWPVGVAHLYRSMSQEAARVADRGGGVYGVWVCGNNIDPSLKGGGTREWTADAVGRGNMSLISVLPLIASISFRLIISFCILAPLNRPVC